MKKLILKEEALEIIARENNLVIIKKMPNGFLATNFKKTYLLSKERNENNEEIWAHNQPWIVYEVDDKFDLPIWFSKELYEQSVTITNASLPDPGSNIYKKIIPILKGDGFCYIPSHNNYTGGDWYANNSLQAVVDARLNWTPLWDISLNRMDLLYDNGEMGYTSKGMQIWANDYEHFLTFFHSRKEKATNINNYPNNAITLVKYATDNQDSKWRKFKRWKEFLSFKGEIGEFKEVSVRDGYGIGTKVTEVIKVATAGKYILAKMEWGALFGGEGDVGEDLYIFESEEELIEKLESLHNIKDNN